MKTRKRLHTDALPVSEACTELLENLTAFIAPLQSLHQQAAEAHASTASYINACREMWDSDDKNETEVES